MRKLRAILACLVVLAACSTTEGPPDSVVPAAQPEIAGTESVQGSPTPESTAVPEPVQPKPPTRILSIAEILDIHSYREVTRSTFGGVDAGRQFEEEISMAISYTRNPAAAMGNMEFGYGEIEFIASENRTWTERFGRWVPQDDNEDVSFGEPAMPLGPILTADQLQALRYVGPTSVNGIPATAYELGAPVQRELTAVLVGPGAQLISGEGEVYIADAGFIAGYKYTIRFTSTGELEWWESVYEISSLNAHIEILPPGLWARQPEGTRGLIAFAREDDSQAGIFVMRPDGTGVTRLTSAGVLATNPAWSPDGEQIAFAAGGKSDWDLYVLTYADGDIRQLTDSEGIDMNPTWSPESDKIAFTSNRDGDFEIFVIDLLDGSVRQLTTNDWDETAPSWSPEGDLIAFDSERDGDSRMFVIKPDGTGETELVAGPSGNWLPIWSPDATRIAFLSNRHSGSELYSMAPDGSDVVRLTHAQGSEWYMPTWSPSGQSVAFCSDRDANWEIYTVDHDGANSIRVTNDPAQDRYPTWSPASVNAIPECYPPDAAAATGTE